MTTDSNKGPAPPTSVLDREGLGRLAWAAYWGYPGLNTADWEGLSSGRREAWCRAAEAVAIAAGLGQSLTEDERRDVEAIRKAHRGVEQGAVDYAAHGDRGVLLRIIDRLTVGNPATVRGASSGDALPATKERP